MAESNRLPSQTSINEPESNRHAFLPLGNLADVRGIEPLAIAQTTRRSTAELNVHGNDDRLAAEFVNAEPGRAPGNEADLAKFAPSFEGGTGRNGRAPRGTGWHGVRHLEACKRTRIRGMKAGGG